MLALPKFIASQSACKKISSIQKLIPQILGSHELNGHIHPKIIKITFSFPEFAPACKKSVYAINLFLR